MTYAELPLAILKECRESRNRHTRAAERVNGPEYGLIEIFMFRPSHGNCAPLPATGLQTPVLQVRRNQTWSADSASHAAT